MPIPTTPKIYHIVNVDRLPSIVADGYLWCDAKINMHPTPGTTIGMNKIKQRRLKLPLNSHPGLHVGDCVPFYFCPRSVMLYMIHRKNPELTYQGGQGPIIHLEADLRQTVAWAEENELRWAFTRSNAGSNYFEDRCNLAQLGEIDWNAVQARDWSQPKDKEGKQAEFLLEHQFSWKLVSRIGVQSKEIYQQVIASIRSVEYKPQVEIKLDWYYN